MEDKSYRIRKVIAKSKYHNGLRYQTISLSVWISCQLLSMFLIVLGLLLYFTFQLQQYFPYNVANLLFFILCSYISISLIF